tara:strand:+ start:3498 stop:5696 length:2199 start_codon:yes stop_codon:yes gene_type:complete
MEAKNVGGIDFVRPPLLSIKKKEETKDYKEYEVTTFKTPKDRSGTNENDPNYIFTSMTDSMIFCNETMKIQIPKKQFMIRKDGTRKFAYAFGMFPYPKTGKAAYLDGCILGALGLKRQRVKADVICFVTPDINLQDRLKLAVVFDKVIRVPYISPYDMPDDGIEELKTIKMDPKIFDNCHKYTKMHPYTHVFFKLHIFNPDLFPYEKVCFVDSDLVPMNYYDSLFMLNTPAGWVEYRKKFPYKESYSWDRCDFLKHGEKIPKIFTDIDTPGGADVNAGLLVISPNKREYNSMIKEITSPIKQWMGPDKIHRGFYDFNFNSPTGSKFVSNSYCYPEQNYLTKRFSGKWTFIEFAFQSWSLDPCNSFGIHMAAFNPKPWFKQPAGNEIKLTSKPQPYVKMFEEDNQDLQTSENVAKAFVMFGDTMDETQNYENISVSYELFNDLIIWGMVHYPDLHTFFMEQTEIHGSKGSFDKDVFKPISKQHQFLKFKEIKKGSSVYKRLTKSQKYICNLINNYDKFVPQIKDKLTSICKTKMNDRYGNYNVNYAIINYPDVKDIYETEEDILLERKKIPFGRFKGKLIKQLTEDDMKEFFKMKKFTQNKNVRQYFRKTKFKKLLKPENEYNDMKIPTKSLQGKSKRRRLKTNKKQKYEFMYVYMDNCKYCKQMDPIWSRLIRKYKNKLKLTKINGPTRPKLLKKYNISQFPTLILVAHKPIEYKGDRTFSKIVKFINKHIS